MRLRVAGRLAPDPFAGGEPLPWQRCVGVVDAPLDVGAEVFRPAALTDNLAIRLPQLLVHADRVPVSAVPVGPHLITVGRGYPLGQFRLAWRVRRLPGRGRVAATHMATH
jgi:hypothetical protein